MLTIRERHRSQGFCIPNIQDKYTKAQAMEELKKDFENQVREVEEKLGREMREMQVRHEKLVSTLLKEAQKKCRRK